MKAYFKLIIITAIIFLTLSNSTTAQNLDKVNIEKVIDNYIIGWRLGNIGLLEEAFDLDAGVVLWVDKKENSEKLKSMELSSLAESVKPHEAYGIGYEIQNLDIVNNQLAIAKVRIPLPTKNSYYIDYLQLQKINDKWRIVLKSFVYFPQN